MSSSADSFLKKALGADFFQSLEKVELWKMGTKTVVDHEEIKTALQIVPRTLMSFLISNLQPMLVGETKEVALPIKHGDHPILRVSKHEKDVYSGELEDSTEKYTDKKVAEFKYRSIPGIGLVIMSAFELYDVDELDKESKHDIPDATITMVQKLIDERLALHDLIGKVVDKKITQRDAIQSLVLAKLNSSMDDTKHKKAASDIQNIADIATDDPAAKKDNYLRGIANGLQIANAAVNDGEPQFIEADGSQDKSESSKGSLYRRSDLKSRVKKRGSPLKNFLDSRRKKLKKNEFKIELMKGEQVHCPDCGQRVFDGDIFGACICYGDCGKVFLKKTEDGFKIRFSKNWDTDNIEMLLEILRKNRNG